MAKIEREIKHSLGLDGAKTKVSSIIEKLQKNYGSVISDIKWNADKTAADISGKGFSGNFKVSDSAVNLKIELGLLTSAFKGKIEKEIDEQVKDIK